MALGDLVPGKRLALALRDLNNLANCLCELDKYCRVKLGEGKPRSKYVAKKS